MNWWHYKCMILHLFWDINLSQLTHLSLILSCGPFPAFSKWSRIHSFPALSTYPSFLVCPHLLHHHKITYILTSISWFNLSSHLYHPSFHIRGRIIPVCRDQVSIYTRILSPLISLETSSIYDLFFCILNHFNSTGSFPSYSLVYLIPKKQF